VSTLSGKGLETEGHEIYVCGDEKRGDFITRTEVTGVAEVKIGGKRFKCLRGVWTDFERDGSSLKLAKLFISEQGRTVFSDDTTVAGLTTTNNLRAILS